MHEDNHVAVRHRHVGWRGQTLAAHPRILCRLGQKLGVHFLPMLPMRLQQERTMLSC